MGTISVSLPSDGTTGDVADVNTPINTIVSEINGNLDNANIKSAAAIAGSKLADNSIDLEAKSSADSGWREVTESWAYASATTITVPSDATTKYMVGDKIKFSQSGEKQFIIQAVTSTLLTVYGPDGDVVANAAISDIYYSKVSTPQGMPSQGVSMLPIGRATLTGAADTITVTNLPSRKYLQIKVAVFGTGGTVNPELVLNNDTADSSYNRRVSDSFGADSASAGVAINLVPAASAESHFIIIDIYNVAARNKLIISKGITDVGDGSSPTSRDMFAQFEDSTNIISRVDIINNGGTGDFAIGSECVVFGHD